MKTYEFSARNIDEAISAGLEQLGVDIGDVTIDILEEGSKGLFGLFGSRQAKVRLTLKEEEEREESVFAGALDVIEPETPKAAPKSEKPKAQKTDTAPQKAQRASVKATPVKEAAPAAKEAPAKADPAPKAAVETPVEKKKPAPRKPRPVKTEQAESQDTAPAQPVEIVPAPQADRATAEGKAQEFLQKLTSLMGVTVSVAVRRDEEGNVRVDMRGDTLGILIGRRGETLDALQYLTSLQVNKGENDYTRVTLDTENYRAKREEALVRLANRMANRCQKTGRKVSLEPMNPYERRILHSALQNHEAVTTHSEGEEPNRHVVITLK